MNNEQVEARFDKADALLAELPDDLRERISYGLYGPAVQYFIVGVDGYLAQLGEELPQVDRLRQLVENADKEHARLMRERAPKPSTIGPRP